jgi:cell shape-determining protein MreD
MKKFKQILAVLGIVFLLSLYVITLLCAIFDSSDTMQLFQASVLATIIIPVLLWAYSFIYRLLKNDKDSDE